MKKYSLEELTDKHIGQLGELVGVKKAQISKIENSTTDARFETILKVFKALDAKLIFNVELNKRKLAY